MRAMMRKANFRNIFDNAVFYLKLDELNGDAIDVINENNFKLNGGVNRGVNGLIGTAYSFDGNNGYLSELNNVWNNVNSNNFTFGVWFETFDNSVGQTIISDINGNDFFDRKIFIEYNSSSKKIAVRIGKDSSTTLALDSTTLIQNNTKYLIIFKYDANGDAKLKINNVLEDSDTFTSASTVENQIYIGQSGLNAAFLKGILDEMFFINGQTSSGVDSDLWNNGQGKTY